MPLDLITKSGMQTLADGVHTACGALCAWSAIVLFHTSIWWMLIPTVIFTSGKEYWWDINYETEDTSGGYLGGIRDQAGWIVGFIAATGLWYAAN